MSSTIVISGSASLSKEIEYWKNYWQEQGKIVLDYPVPIPPDSFLEEYPQVHQHFFQQITQTDLLFIMNENKKDITGYIGAETFAELAFGVAQKLIYKKNIEIILLQIPESRVQSYDEIQLWLQLGWIKLFKK